MEQVTIKQEPITHHIQPSVTFFATMQRDRDQATTSAIAGMDEYGSDHDTIVLSDTEVPVENKRKAIDGEDDLQLQPPTKKQDIREYAFYHCITPNRMLSSSANSRHKTPGADYILCSIRHVKPTTGNGSGEHWHSIVRFDAKHCERALKSKNGITNQIGGKAKRITDLAQYKNILEYVRRGYEIQWTPRIDAEAKKWERYFEYKIKRFDAGKYDTKEELVSVEQLDRAYDEMVERPDDANAIRKYQYVESKLKEHEALKEYRDRIVRKRAPMTPYQEKVMAYDFLSRKSTFKLAQLLDLHKYRSNHQTLCGKTPIYMLVGVTSAAKTKIAQAFANTISEKGCAFPLTGYNTKDNLALSDWFNSGSDVLVFDDFSFEASVSKGSELEIFSLFKQWTSGQPIHPRVALTGNQSKRDVTQQRLVKAVIISMNSLPQEWANLANSMTEFNDRFEFIVFNEDASYQPFATNTYVKLYDDSHTVADECLVKWGKWYYSQKYDMAQSVHQLTAELIQKILPVEDDPIKLQRIEAVRRELDAYDLRKWPMIDGHYNSKVQAYRTQQERRSQRTIREIVDAAEMANRYPNQLSNPQL